MKLQEEFKRATRNFVRSGGKTNRKMQLKRMQSFVIHCRSMGCTSLNQVGKRQVMNYYESCENLAESTLLNHYYAIKQLMKLALISCQIPKPNLKEINQTATYE